jgi:hypothetical protein
MRIEFRAGFIIRKVQSSPEFIDIVKNGKINIFGLNPGEDLHKAAMEMDCVFLVTSLVFENRLGRRVHYLMATEIMKGKKGIMPTN